jgi:hypothetical protein
MSFLTGIQEELDQVIVTLIQPIRPAISLTKDQN